MKKQDLKRLIEISRLDEEGRNVVLSSADSPVVTEYLEKLEALKSLQIPPPSATKMWHGRDALLLAVQASHDQRTSAGWWRRSASLIGLPAGLASVVLIVSVTSAAVVTDVPGSRSMVGDVMSALGIEEGGTDMAPYRGPVMVPNTDLRSDAPSIAEQPAPLNDASTPESSDPSPGQSAENLSGGAQTNSAEDPGQGGENPGQGGTPPGQGGENPGQGGTPPGQGGENPGQGGTPPGQGGENPGQGGTPPGQGGENPGHGGTPPGQGGENPGQGGTPPGQGGENPGHGGTPPGQGGENPGQGGTPPGQGGENPGKQPH